MIEITSDAIERVGTLLADVPKGAERVFASAMNRGISRVKTQAIKQVKTVYAVNGAALTKATRINITKASTGNLAGFVSFSGVKIPLYKFKVTPTKPGTGKQVRAAVKKGGSGTPFEDRDVARIALSVLNEKVRFLQKPENSTVTRKRLYPTYPPWEELMQDVGKIKLTMNPEKKTLERTWQWLNVAVSPSLKLMDKIGKLDNRDYIRQLIERGQMNEEQQRIYEDYKKSFLLREEERRIFDRTYTEHDTDKESPYSE